MLTAHEHARTPIFHSRAPHGVIGAPILVLPECDLFACCDGLSIQRVLEGEQESGRDDTLGDFRPNAWSARQSLPYPQIEFAAGGAPATYPHTGPNIPPRAEFSGSW